MILRTADIVDLTGLSMRYWQRRLASGEVPGVEECQLGKRRTFLIDADTFATWWKSQTRPVCPETYASAARSTGIASEPRAGRSKDRLRPASLESLKNGLRE